MDGLPAVVLLPSVEPSELMVKRTVLLRMCWCGCVGMVGAL